MIFSEDLILPRAFLRLTDLHESTVGYKHVEFSFQLVVWHMFFFALTVDSYHFDIIWNSMAISSYRNVQYILALLFFDGIAKLNYRNV